MDCVDSKFYILFKIMPSNVKILTLLKCHI